jgi:hypothetical protein
LLDRVPAGKCQVRPELRPWNRLHQAAS